MSDSDQKQEKEKKHPFEFFLFALIVLAFLATLLFYQEQKSKVDAPYDEFNLSKEVGNSLNSIHEIDPEKLSMPRIMGDATSPVKIAEYMSFTCGACGIYNKTTFEKIKKEYIDTGKAYLVFYEIPRNVQDVSIGAISRCVPEKSYFKFLQLVFDTQKEWVESADVIKQIKEKAVIAGASPKAIELCYQNKELRMSLVEEAEKTFEEYEIEYTPSLVINDSHVVMALSSYEEIRDIIEDELAKAETLAKESIVEEENTPVNHDVEAPVVTDEQTEEQSLETEVFPVFIEPQAGFEEEKHIELDIKALAEPRVLGDSNAPLKISAHNSFTCSACKTFHMESFERIKADYIDTGKAYLVFEDFPRNNPDVTISAIARCVPEKSYFKFIKLIYKTQSQWMKGDYYKSFIKQNAKLTGADSALIENCSKNKELHETLAARGQYVYETLGVDSTPTFVINDKRKVIGAVPYAQFRKVLEEEFAKVKAENKGKSQ